LLLSFLLDGLEENAAAKLWNIFHDFYIDSDTMETIRSQSEKLVPMLASMESWEKCVYGKVVHLVNDETRDSLRELFTTYSNAPKTEQSISKDFKSAAKNVFRTYYDKKDFPPTLTRSFGILATYSTAVASLHMQQFWEYGVADLCDRPKATICNPLFVYSGLAGDKFAVNSGSNPLAVYPLSANLPSDMSSESPFHKTGTKSQSDVKNALERVVKGARKQFSAWFSSFQHFVKQGGNIVLRYVVADPIAFCFALQQRNSPLHVQFPILLSSAWSGKTLCFPDDRHSGPAEFNVIDTSTLIDDISAIDVLVAIAPLLEKSPVSSISTETVSRPWSQECEFLRDVFCQETLLLCVILGISPLGYLTGTTPRGLSQDIPIILDYSGSQPSPLLCRVTWKISASGDSNVDFNRLAFSCDAKDLSSVLSLLHSRMMDRKPRIRGNGELASAPPNNYTNLSFVVLVAFLKRHLCTQWSDALKELMHGKRDMSGPRDVVEELETQMHLFGLFSGFQFSAKGMEDGIALTRQPAHGVLALADPPPVTCVVFTVPRQHLRPLYETCVTNRGVDCALHLRIYKLPKLYSVYSNLVPLFGKLIPSPDRRTCQIESDKAGWHGSSDLHICVYLPTFMLQTHCPQHVSLNLSTEQDASQFRREYGAQLEIFKSAFDNASKVQLVESVPGKPIPKPISIPSLDEKPIDSNGRTITQPKLRPLDPHLAFVIRIDFPSDTDHKVLSAGAKVSMEQTSPCVITVSVGTMQHACQFPFPVDGISAKLRIARKSGWIELIAEPHVLFLSSGKAGYMKAPWPLTYDAQSNSLCNWNMPYVNFNNIPAIVLEKGFYPPWYDTHLRFMFSSSEDQERARSNTSVPMIQFKHALTDAMQCVTLKSLTNIPVRFAVNLGQGVGALFMVTGLFLDPSLHNIIAEAYVVEGKQNTALGTRIENVEHMTLPLGGSEDIRFWRAAIPAMIERCRDWEHGGHCERQSPTSDVVVCSCGMGKSVSKEFWGVEEWAELGPYVTRCAVSPVFAPPYIVQMRSSFLDLVVQSAGMTDEDIHACHRNPTVCKVCGCSGKTRKCGRCTKAYYCGKDCQTKDWKTHKRACRAPQ
jgi:MYND finger